MRKGIAVKRKITSTEITCDCCREVIPENECSGKIYFEHMGYTYGGGSSVGVDIIAAPHRSDIPSDEQAICMTCAKKALFNASKTLPEWMHALRANAIVKEFLCWYDNGMRDRRDLDRIYDKASDLFGDQ